MATVLAARSSIETGRKYRRDVLPSTQQSHNIQMVTALEVEPKDGKALHTPCAQRRVLSQ